MKRPRWLLLITLAVTLSGAVLAWQFALREDKPLEREVPPGPYRHQEGFPPDIVKALPEARSWILYSLDGGLLKKADTRATFADYPIRGQIALKDPKPAFRAMEDLIEAGSKWQGSVTLCFSPRHGLSAVLKDGRRIELLICYQCCRAELNVEGRRVNGIFWDDGYQPDPAPLNLLLQEHHIPGG